MSMRQAKAKQTKGKQKIEMKKVETYENRMITFTKRKYGIYKKLNEIITMCDVEAAFLVFSETGKPYSFAHSSMEDLADRLMNPSEYEPNNTGPVVEAYKKRRNEGLMKEYTDLCEQVEMANEKLKVLKESRNEKEMSKMWWNKPIEGALSEDLMQRHKTFVELYDSLCDLALLRFGKYDGGGSSSGRVERGP